VPTDSAEVTPGTETSNRISPLRFVLLFGLVSSLADFVYEGARSVIGPYLATLGASAAFVGTVTGAGEAVALVFRLLTGRVSDRWQRHWAQSIAGYAITIVSVPLLALATPLWAASLLFNTERFGKAVRTPARDTMLSQAATDMGRGWTFGLHEALDQTGALGGPLVIALVLWLGHGYRAAFAVLAIPGVLALFVLLVLRRLVPSPAAYEGTGRSRRTLEVSTRLGPVFWTYAAFSALTMLGFATFAVLAFHLQTRHVVSTATIPVVYGVAMIGAAFAALGFGRVYDRSGLRGLVTVPALAAVVPFLSFAHSSTLVWLGALVWGVALGVHESTMRAAVGDLVAPERRGAGYGTFTAVYGLAWLAGSATIGALYDVSIAAATVFVVAVQAAAVVAYVVLLRVVSRSRTDR
jgi:MFS family permease